MEPALSFIINYRLQEQPLAAGAVVKIILLKHKPKP